ncbi:hypothetical protein FCV25MIE_19273 [Fagus crenata]
MHPNHVIETYTPLFPSYGSRSKRGGSSSPCHSTVVSRCSKIRDTAVPSFVVASGWLRLTTAWRARSAFDGLASPRLGAPNLPSMASPHHDLACQIYLRWPRLTTAQCTKSAFDGLPFFFLFMI